MSKEAPKKPELGVEVQPPRLLPRLIAALIGAAVVLLGISMLVLSWR